MLPHRHRLRRSTDIQAVRRRGRRRRHKLMTLYTLSRNENSHTVSRFAFSASRQVGNAVTRNLAKRRMRGIVHQQLSNVRSGYDCLVVVHPFAAQAGFRELESGLLTLLSQAGILAAELKPAESD